MANAPIGEGPIETVRTFTSGMKMGVGGDAHGRHWVYDLPDGRSWHKHTGPFHARQEAVDWINGVTDTGDRNDRGGRQ